jgi:hypothetical protein
LILLIFQLVKLRESEYEFPVVHRVAYGIVVAIEYRSVAGHQQGTLERVIFWLVFVDCDIEVALNLLVLAEGYLCPLVVVQKLLNGSLKLRENIRLGGFYLGIVDVYPGIQLLCI